MTWFLYELLEQFWWSVPHLSSLYSTVGVPTKDPVVLAAAEQQIRILRAPGHWQQAAATQWETQLVWIQCDLNRHRHSWQCQLWAYFLAGEGLKSDYATTLTLRDSINQHGLICLRDLNKCHGHQDIKHFSRTSNWQGRIWHCIFPIFDPLTAGDSPVTWEVRWQSVGPTAEWQGCGHPRRPDTSGSPLRGAMQSAYTWSETQQTNKLTH